MEATSSSHKLAMHRFSAHRYTCLHSGLLLVLCAYVVIADIDFLDNDDVIGSMVTSNITDDLPTAEPPSTDLSQPIFDFLIPTCDSGEFLRSNESHIFCVEIRKYISFSKQILNV